MHAYGAELEVCEEILDAGKGGVVDGEVDDYLVHYGPEELGPWMETHD
jgi:hypothetical protein